MWPFNKPKTEIKKDDKSKYYVKKKPDLISWAFYLVLLSLFYFILIKKMTNVTTALPVLILVPLMISIIFFYLIIPYRILGSIFSALVVYTYTWNCKKNTPAKTVVVIGKTNYKSPSYWYSPNFELDLLVVIKYLKEKKEDFSIYNEINTDTFDEIMSNKTIRTVYIFGHGRRHGFAVDSNTVIDYCKYKDKKFAKDYVYQIHCNQGGGASLVEYVVPEKNWEECNPDQGYMSAQTITEMYIDKISKQKQHGKVLAGMFKLYYYFMTAIIPLLALLLWIQFLTMIIIK